MKLFRVVIRIALIISMFLVIFSVVAKSTDAFSSAPESVAAETDSENGEEADAAENAGPAESTGLVGDIITLGLLILLQAVLGFDNLLYISLESKHAPADKQKFVRSWGIGLAIVLRIGLLFLLVSLQEVFEKFSVWQYDFPGYASGHFNIHSLIVLAGGAFIIYTAMKEIWHMTRLEHDDHGGGEAKKKSLGSIIFWIVVMNIVFSFDSILSAMALTKVFWVMAVAIVLSGLLMIWLSDQVANFLERNRMYEVLGLFVLFVVGIMLVSEGGHLAHLSFFGNQIEAMSKTTFYFVLVVLLLTDVAQGAYQTKLLAEEEKQPAKTA